MMPQESAFDTAAEWRIGFPSGFPDNQSGEIFLKIAYTGDVAHFERNHNLLDDNFFNGEPWTIGLRRYLDGRKAQSFQLRILPLRSDSQVYLERLNRKRSLNKLQIVELGKIAIIPEYRFMIETK